MELQSFNKTVSPKKNTGNSSLKFQIQEHFEIMAILNLEEEITLEEEQERALQEQMDIGK